MAHRRAPSCRSASNSYREDVCNNLVSCHFGIHRLKLAEMRKCTTRHIRHGYHATNLIDVIHANNRACKNS